MLNAAGFTSQNDNWTVNTNTITGVGGTADGIYVAVPPRCIAVREQFVRVYGKKLGEVSRGQYQGVKARDRNRDVPLSSSRCRVASPGHGGIEVERSERSSIRRIEERTTDQCG